MTASPAESLHSELSGSQQAAQKEPDAITIPEKSWTEWAIALVLFVASCLYLRLFYNYIRFQSDEGFALQGAQRILHGQVLYRDFFSFYTPGSYYWLALLFKVFGSSMLVTRGALVVYGGLFSAITYLIARRVCSRPNAILATLPTLIVGLPGWFFVMHSWDSTLWALITLYFAVRSLESRRWAWTFGLGTFTAVTFLVEQPKGGGLALGLCIGFFVLVMKDGLRAWTGNGRLIAFALAFALPMLITLAYFAAHGGTSQMGADLMWPFYHYSAPSRLPFGYIQSEWLMLFDGSLVWHAFIFLVLSPFFIVSALPIFALFVMAYSISESRKKGNVGGPWRYYLVVSSVLFGLLLSTLAAARPDSTHFILQAPLYCLVLGWMAEAAKTPFLKIVKVLGITYLLASFAALGLSFLMIPLSAKYKVDTGGGTLRTTVPIDSLAYIRKCVTPGEKILVYPDQPLYYYLTRTYSISRYDRLLVGTYEPSQFQEMARELATSKPRVVLFDPSFIGLIPIYCPNVDVKALAAKDPVEEYVLAHYHPCGTFGNPAMRWHVVVMMRRDLKCPARKGGG